MSIVIRNANVYEAGHFVKKAEVVIESSENEIIEAEGLTLIPGLIDVHEHLRQPGFEYKETVLSATKAAAKGGYTTIFAMPNLKPCPDSKEHMLVEVEAIKKDAVVNVIPYGCLTVGQSGRGETADYAALRQFTNVFSDDGKGVQAKERMQQAMEKLKTLDGIVVAHCEDESLLAGGYVHQGEWAQKHGYKGISSESEFVQVQRDLQLAYTTGCQYHICHISTKESVEALAKYRNLGAKVSGEVTPHHLLLVDEDICEDNGRFKMNPPLRSKADRKALVEALVNGTIEVVATDHAPHSYQEKSKGLAGSAMGTVGNETAFPLLYTYLVKENIISLEKLIEVMYENPKRIFKVDTNANDLVLVDLNAHEIIDPANFLSMGKASPFTGWEVYGLPVYTFVKGKIVYRR